MNNSDFIQFTLQLADRLGIDIVGIRAQIGNMLGLNTNHKTTLVGAINEVDSKVGVLGGLRLESDQANSRLILKDGSGNVLSNLDVAYLNNEGTTFNLNQATGRIELLNDQGQVLSSADLQSFIKNMIVNASFHNVNKYQLEFFTSDGSTAFTVPFKIENIQGLQNALDVLNDKIIQQTNNIKIGGRNYVPDSIGSYIGTSIQLFLTERFKTGDVLTISATGRNNASLYLYHNNGNGWAFTVVNFNSPNFERKEYTFTIAAFDGGGLPMDGSYPYLVMLNHSAFGGNSTSEIKNIKLERGNKATDWTPAIEDFNISKVLSYGDSAPSQGVVLHNTKLKYGQFWENGTRQWLMYSNGNSNELHLRDMTAASNLATFYVNEIHLFRDTTINGDIRTPFNITTQLYGSASDWYAKADGMENATGVGFSNGSFSSLPYIYHKTGGYKYLATIEYINNQDYASVTYVNNAISSSVTGKFFPRRIGSGVINPNIEGDGIVTAFQWINTPISTIAVLTTKVYSPDWIRQTFELMDGSGTTWVRDRHSGTTWGAWISQWNENNFDPNTKANVSGYYPNLNVFGSDRWHGQIFNDNVNIQSPAYIMVRESGTYDWHRMLMGDFQDWVGITAINNALPFKADVTYVDAKIAAIPTHNGQLTVNTTADLVGGYVYLPSGNVTTTLGLATHILNAIGDGQAAYNWGNHATAGYTTLGTVQNWVVQQGFLTASALNGYVLQSSLTAQLANYATLAGTQTFTGQITFNQAPIVPNGSLGGHTVNLGQMQNYVSNAIGNISIPNGQLTFNVTSDFVGGFTYLPNGNITTTLGLATHVLNAIADGQTAYNWGNHATAGYLTLGALNGYATQNWVWTVINSLAIKTRQYDPTDPVNNDYWDKINIKSFRHAYGFDVCNYEPQAQEYVSIFDKYGAPYLNEGILGSIALICPHNGTPVIKGTVESQVNLNQYINNNEIYFCLRYYRDTASPSSFSGELMMLSSIDVANYIGYGNMEMFNGVIILGVATADNTLMVQHREF